MFSIRQSQLLFKRLIKSHPSRTKKALSTLTNNHLQWLFFNQNIKTSSNIQFYSFSSFPQSLRQTEYQEGELALLNDYEPEKLPEKRKVMEKYLQCKDLGLLNPDDIALISDTLCYLAVAHNFGGNKEKALKYFKEDEGLNNKAGIRDTIGLAHNFFVQGGIYLDQNNLKDAQHYLNKADKICRLLEGNKDAKSLLIHCCCSFARISYLQNDQDKAFELYNSVLERTGDLPEEELPNLIMSVSEGLGSIYSLRNDTEKAMEHWTKGLETTTQLFGESSLEAYSSSSRIAGFLYHQGQTQRALPYAKQSLQIALQIYPKDHPEVALNYLSLGYIEKDYTKALNSIKKAIRIYEKLPPQEVADYLSRCYFQSARTLALQSKPSEASNFLAKAGSSVALIFDGKELAEIYLKWAEELKELGNVMEDAKSYYLKAANIYENCEPLDSPSLVYIYANLGNIVYREQDWEKACEFMKKSESYFAAAEMNPEYTKAIYAYLTTASLRTGEVADGFKYAQKVLDCYEACGDLRHVGEAHFHLGVLHEHEGRLKEALEAFKKSLEFPEMAPHGPESRIPMAQERIAEIESKLKIVKERNSEASHKISQVLKTFKIPPSKK